MKYDDILREIGDIGPYQRKVFAMLCLPVLLAGCVVMSSVFIMTEPSHRCAIPGLLNDTYNIQNEYHRLLVNLSIPPATDDGDDDDDEYSNCLVYSDFNISHISVSSSIPNSENTSRMTRHCKKWVHDDIDFKSSINTEFDLVCDDTVMRSTTNMSMFGGALIGCFLFGLLADILGRKMALFLSLSIQMICGISLYFIPSLVPVIVMRAVQGLSTQMFGIAAATGMELMGPSKRTLAGIAIEFAWCAGQFILLAVAYLSGDWRIIQLVFGVATVPIMILFIFFPESPRWLLDKGRLDEAEKILQKIADSNKKELPPGSITSDTGDEGPQLQIWEMFKHKVLIVRSLILFYNWFAVNFLYYGLGLNLDNLAGNLYLNFFISAVTETIAYVIVLILLDRTGRKRLHTVCMFISSLSCLVVIFPVIFGSKDDEWTATALAMVGKMAASCCYAILYIMTVEIFPTVVRNSGLAFCSIFENTSAMTAPYVADLGKLVGGSLAKALPMLVFGGFSLLAALMSLHLPETLNKPLPETKEDALNFGRKDKKDVESDEKQNDIEMKKIH